MSSSADNDAGFQNTLAAMVADPPGQHHNNNNNENNNNNTRSHHTEPQNLHAFHGTFLDDLHNNNNSSNEAVAAAAATTVVNNMENNNEEYIQALSENSVGAINTTAMTMTPLYGAERIDVKFLFDSWCLSAPEDVGGDRKYNGRMVVVRRAENNNSNSVNPDEQVANSNSNDEQNSSNNNPDSNVSSPQLSWYLELYAPSHSILQEEHGEIAVQATGINGAEPSLSSRIVNGGRSVSGAVISELGTIIKLTHVHERPNFGDHNSNGDADDDGTSAPHDPMMAPGGALPTGCATEQELAGDTTIDATTSHSNSHYLGGATRVDVNALSSLEGHDADSGLLITRTREFPLNSSLLNLSLLNGRANKQGNEDLAISLLEGVGHKARIAAHLMRDVTLDGLKHELHIMRGKHVYHFLATETNAASLGVTPPPQVAAALDALREPFMRWTRTTYPPAHRQASRVQFFRILIHVFLPSWEVWPMEHFLSWWGVVLQKATAAASSANKRQTPSAVLRNVVGRGFRHAAKKNKGSRTRLEAIVSFILNRDTDLLSKQNNGLMIVRMPGGAGSASKARKVDKHSNSHQINNSVLAAMINDNQSGNDMGDMPPFPHHLSVPPRSSKATNNTTNKSAAATAAAAASAQARRKKLLDPPDDRLLMSAYGDMLPERESLLDRIDGSLDATVAPGNRNISKSKLSASHNVAMNQRLQALVKSARHTGTAYDGQALVNRFQAICAMARVVPDHTSALMYLASNVIASDIAKHSASAATTSASESGEIHQHRDQHDSHDGDGEPIAVDQNTLNASQSTSTNNNSHENVDADMMEPRLQQLSDFSQQHDENQNERAENSQEEEHAPDTLQAIPPSLRLLLLSLTTTKEDFEAFSCRELVGSSKLVRTKTVPSTTKRATDRKAKNTDPDADADAGAAEDTNQGNLTEENEAEYVVADGIVDKQYAAGLASIQGGLEGSSALNRLHAKVARLLEITKHVNDVAVRVPAPPRHTESPAIPHSAAMFSNESQVHDNGTSDRGPLHAMMNDQHDGNLTQETSRSGDAHRDGSVDHSHSNNEPIDYSHSNDGGNESMNHVESNSYSQSIGGGNERSTRAQNNERDGYIDVHNSTGGHEDGDAGVEQDPETGVEGLLAVSRGEPLLESMNSTSGSKRSARGNSSGNASNRDVHTDLRRSGRSSKRLRAASGDRDIGDMTTGGGGSMQSGGLELL